MSRLTTADEDTRQRCSSASDAAVRGRYIQLLLLAAAVMAAYYSRTALGPLQEALRLSLSLTDNQVALLQGPAQALPVVVAAIPLGLLIDRYARVRMLFLFAVFNIVGTVLTAVASSVTTLFVARCVVGLTATATLTGAYSLLADLYAADQRGRSSMVLAISQMAGSSTAFALGGILLVRTGSGPDNWRWAIFFAACLLGLATVLMLAMREPPRKGRAVENPSFWDTWFELRRYRSLIIPLLTAKVLIEIAFGAVYVWAAPTLARSFALPSDRVGGLMALALLLSGALGPVIGGIVADACQRTGGPRRTLWAISALALLTAPLGLFGMAPAVGWASVMLVLFFVAISATIVTETTLFTVVLPNEIRGLSVAISFAAGTLASLGLAPVVVSVLSGLIGGPAMIGEAVAWVSLSTSALAAGTFAVGIRSFQRQSSDPAQF